MTICSGLTSVVINIAFRYNVCNISLWYIVNIFFMYVKVFFFFFTLNKSNERITVINERYQNGFYLFIINDIAVFIIILFIYLLLLLKILLFLLFVCLFIFAIINDIAVIIYLFIYLFVRACE